MATASYQPDPKETGPVRDSTGEMSTSAVAAVGEAPVDGEEGEEREEGYDAELEEFKKVALKIARQAESSHRTAFSRRSGGWQRAYRAYRGEHFAGSKYLTKEFESRSKIFIPKTRSAVRKNQTAIAAALFSTDEVVSVRPEYSDDDRQNASAAVIHADMNYRLDRSSPRGGIPWFTIVMGAHQDAQFAGICCSKQDWEYEEKVVGEEPVMGPVPDPFSGEPILDETGEPMMAPTEEMQPVIKVIKDRPMIHPIPPENIIIDPAAPYYDPVQGAGYIILRCPTLLGDVKKMITNPARNPKSRVKWRQVSDTDLQKAVTAYDAAGIRRAREGGDDRMEQRANAVNDFSVTWLHENFIRYDGCDYQFWSVGTQLILSEPAKVEEIYPAFDGDRPITYGYGAIEAHNTAPLSPVESWQPLQQEINDLRNLRLDAAKQSVLPFATVAKGKGIDVSVLTRLAPGSHIHVNEQADIQFREIPNGAMSAIGESSNLNVEFDEQAGQFSGSSVQTTREMNETVGGMRLLSGSANATTEFDLRVFVETWVEPTLRQFVKLIQFYENDQIVLSIAAEKAELFDKFGIDQVTDDMLTSEVSVKVNVGIGAADPMQKISKLQAGMGILQPIFAAADPATSPTPNLEEIVPEVFGAIGWKDGKRFFHWPDPNAPPPEPPPDPAMLKAQADAQAAEQKIEIEAKSKEASVAIAREEMQGKLDIARDEMHGKLILQLQNQSMNQQFKAGEQNRAMVEEQMGGGGEGEGGSSAAGAAPLAALTKGFEQLGMAIINAQQEMARSQAQSSQQIARMVAQSRTDLRQLVAAVSAPKRTDVVRGLDGKIAYGESRTVR